MRDDIAAETFPSSSTFLASGLRHSIIVPLISKDRVIATLGLRSYEVGVYGPREQAILEGLANQIAPAVENAQLYQQTKKAEEQLKEIAANLERSNLELQEFVSIASHDLQEPLRKLQAFGNRLQSGYSETLTGRGGEDLRSMIAAAERMQLLIDALLSLSRVTTRAREFVPVDLTAVAGRVLRDLEPAIDEVGGRVELGELATIDADPSQMRQLLHNLIGNALKFRKKETPPVVKVRGQVLDGAVDTGRNFSGEKLIELTVEDSGIGFEEKHLDRIFKVFQRLHGQGEYPGTGVGLAVCRKIVEGHSGTITATSKPGIGARFIVTLPVEQPEGGRTRWTETPEPSPS